MPILNWNSSTLEPYWKLETISVQCNFKVRAINIVLAASELVRALGVTSNLISKRHPNGKAYLGSNPVKASNVIYFPPLTAFDSVLFSGQSSIATVANPIVTFPTTDSAPNEYAKNLETFPLIWNACRKLYDLLSSPALEVRLPSGRVIKMQADVREVGATVKYYIDSSQSDVGAEYLLHRSGSTLKKEINLSDPLLGQTTLELLTHIGYKTNLDRANSEFEISISYGSPSYEPNDAAIDVDVHNGANLVNVFAEQILRQRKEINDIENGIQRHV